MTNYFEYSHFDDAEKGPMKFLIPAHFTITDENFNQVKVELGSDSNESRETGKAATQFAKSHHIQVGNNISLHIIDTPGIGDPEGFDKDKQNFQNTIKYISSFKDLNGICVLLKPNNARLDLHFRYCFKELLVHLHKNAAPNIVFCFTNSRSKYLLNINLPKIKFWAKFQFESKARFTDQVILYQHLRNLLMILNQNRK